MRLTENICDLFAKKHVFQFGYSSPGFNFNGENANSPCYLHSENLK